MDFHNGEPMTKARPKYLRARLQIYHELRQNNVCGAREKKNSKRGRTEQPVAQEVRNASCLIHRFSSECE